MSDRFDELVGEVDDPRERERLRRVHDLLLSVDAPPERSPTLGDAAPPSPAPLLPRRRGRALVLLAAALAAASFGAGWLAGARGGDTEPELVIAMSGSGATGSIELLPQDASGNWPMNVLVRGLEPSRDRSDYYELWLTKDGKPVELLRPLHRPSRRDDGEPERALRPAQLRRLGGHARGLGRDPAHDGVSGSQSSKRLPSGSTAQPKRPNSCSSTRSSTSTPASRSCASIASRSRTR